MRFISLSSSDQELLELTRKKHHAYRVRDRAQALLLSDKGLKIDELASIFGVGRDTISDWFDRWEHSGIDGLQDSPGRGRKSSLESAKKKRLK